VEALFWGRPGTQPNPRSTTIPGGADSGVHSKNSPEAALMWCRSVSPPTAGRQMEQMQFCRAQSKNCPQLNAELKITNNIIRGGSWCGQTSWML